MKTHLPRLFLAHLPAEETQTLGPVNPNARKVEGGLSRVNKFSFALSVRHVQDMNLFPGILQSQEKNNAGGACRKS